MADTPSIKLWEKIMQDRSQAILDRIDELFYEETPSNSGWSLRSPDNGENHNRKA